MSGPTNVTDFFELMNFYGAVVSDVNNAVQMHVENPSMQGDVEMSDIWIERSEHHVYDNLSIPHYVTLSYMQQEVVEKIMQCLYSAGDMGV